MITNEQKNSLISFVTPNTSAIIWLELQGLNSYPQYFSEIDYLLDGQLKKFINEGIEHIMSDEVSLFVNKHFGSDLYVLYVTKSTSKKNKEILIEINPLIEIIKNANSDKLDILVLALNQNDTGLEIINHLKKALPKSKNQLIIS